MHDTSKIRALEANIGRTIRGKDSVIRSAVISLIAGGHLLIEDVPGVGKTTLAHSIAKSLGCAFQRIQFTSDLLPTDIIGVTIYNQKKNEFEFRKGPIFSNILLADEINRTTPKTQSCLLEAMNDRQVTVENDTHPLLLPFMVIATQNPLEFQGTYPLPESQLDRFMMRISIGYPSENHEYDILSEQEKIRVENLPEVLSTSDIQELQSKTAEVKVEKSLIYYILKIVAATRSSELISLGVSTRGAMHLYRASQAMAMAEGRDFCIPDDIKAMVYPVLGHRIILRSRARQSKAHSEAVIRDILNNTTVPV